MFALINRSFKLKWYKDQSTDAHGKLYDLVLLHQFFRKTAAFFKRRNAKVISKISEQLSSFHQAVKLSCCLVFRAMKKITERQGRQEKEIN